MSASACSRCLARSWLLVRLGGHLETVRARILELLELGETDLIDAVCPAPAAPAVRRELAEFDPHRALTESERAEVIPVCRHSVDYPAPLRELSAAPAVIYRRGRPSVWEALQSGPSPAVAVVGSRRASEYGRGLAETLGRGLSGAGIAVISGLALGVDAGAHVGALEGAGSTIAVLPGGAERPYPPSKRALYRRIVAAGVALSELPPGAGVWRWTFPARNRIVAALAGMTVVVEAGERSGALITARLARELGRPVGATPGRIGALGSVGPHALIVAGARLVRGPQDVLDHLLGSERAERLTVPLRPALAPPHAAVLRELAAGGVLSAAWERAGLGPGEGLAVLADLELAGHVRRSAGGRYVVSP